MYLSQVIRNTSNLLRNMESKSFKSQMVKSQGQQNPTDECNVKIIQTNGYCVDHTMSGPQTSSCHFFITFVMCQKQKTNWLT